MHSIGFRRTLFPERPESFDDFVMVALFRDAVEIIQSGFEIGDLGSFGVQDFNFLMEGRHSGLIGVNEFLLELFPRPDAGEFYFNVLIRDIPGQLDHLARQVDDFNRFAHFQLFLCDY